MSPSPLLACLPRGGRRRRRRRYVIKARIERAKHLLATTDLTAQQVAERVGFKNPYYFYRLFKRKAGITAGAFARKCDAEKRGRTSQSHRI